MERISRMLRSGLAMMLALCMIISACPIAAFAAGDEINYVSLGDSMTNGYCFTGYKQGEITAEQFAAGTNVYGNDAYPNAFAKHLGKGGATVNHFKGAVSAMRAEDLNYLLGGREKPTDGWFDEVEHYSGTDGDTLKSLYQDKVAEADVITMGIGNAAFGAYMVQYFTRMLGVMGGALPETEKVNLDKALEVLEPAQQEVIKAAYAKMMAEVGGYIPEELGPIANVQDLIDMMAYIGVGFILNYEGALDQIVKLNHDVDVVLLGLMNTTYGMTITGEGFDPIPIGDIVGILFDSLNAYIAALPTVKQAAGEWADANFYYTNMSNPEFIVQVFDDMYENEWVEDVDAYKGLSAATVRSRTLKAYNKDLRPMLMEAMPLNLPEITVEDVANYEFDEVCAGYGNGYQILNRFFAELEQVMVGANPATMPLVMKYITETGDTRFERVNDFVVGVFGAEVEKEISIAIYVALEAALAASVDNMNLTLEGLMGIAGNPIDALGPMPEELNGQPSPKVLRDKLIGWFTGSETGLAMCKVFAMFKVGDGMSVHPTAKAHETFAANVINAYGNYTAKDENIKNVQYVLGELTGFMETYGPEAAKQLLAIWDEGDYQEIINATVEELTETIEARYNDYKDNVIPALTETAEELTAQKAELTAQLTTLNAQLAAKKAELEKVIDQQEIGSVHTPDISIDTVLGNNQQTQVPENDCEGPGNVADELAAAVADLEHAIAVIEALIADVQADIDDMVALATEIAEAIAELEKTMADVAAAAEDLKEAFDAVYAVLTDADAEATSQSFITIFNTAREAAQAAVEALELVAETAAEDITAIDESINTLVEGVEELYAEFDAENKEAALLKVLSVLPEDVLMGAGYVGGAAYKIIAELDLDIEEVLKNLGFDKEAALNAFNAEKAKITAKLTDDLKALEAQYAPQIQTALENLKAEQAKVEKEIEVQFAAYQQAAAAEIENLKAAAQVELDKLNAELAGYQKDLENAAADAVAGIQAQIDRVTGDIAKIEEDLACAIEHVNTELETIHDQIVSDVTDAYNEAIAELQKIHDELVNQFNTAVENLQAAADKAIQDLENLYNETIENLEQAAKDAINDLITEAEKAIDALEDMAEDVKESVKETLEQIRDQLIDSINEAVENAIDALVEKAKEILTDVNDAVTDAITNAANEILNAVREDIKNVQDAIEDILNGALEGAENLKDALVDLGIDGIDTLVDELTKLINDLIHEATHADLTVDDDFLYVAIGDDTALPEGYAELLEKAIEDETGADITLKNEAKAGNTIAKERENLSDVADAGLITIGFGNVNMLNAAVNAALSDTPVSYDWAELVGEDLVPYVQDALADVYAEIDATVETPEIAAVAKAAVESIAYSSVQYAVELPQLIAEIRAINTDAVIVIVGQYNPMDNAVLDLSMMGGSTLDLSEYIDYFVKGVAAHGIAYSIISGDAIFVEAPEVTTENTDTEWSMIDLGKMAMNGFKTLNPNAAGDDYIARQIADALNITYEPSGLLGDVNDDGVVDGRDVIRLAKYVAEYDNIVINSKNSEVTGNDVIDGRDVIRLAKFVAEYEGVTLG